MVAKVGQAGAPVGGAPRWPAEHGRARWLTRIREAIMLDIVDPPMLAQKAAVAIHDAVGMSFTGVAIRGPEGLFAMHGVAGGRHDEVLRRIRVSSGQGLGGKVVSLRRPVTVTDYVHDPAITTHFRDLAVMEELGGMTAVPVLSEGDVVAILYSATRNVGSLGERAVATLDTAAAALGDLFGVAVRHDDAIRQRAAAERQRIAEELHDSLGHVLFAIGASARSLRPGAGGGHRAAEVGREIEDHAALASSCLRKALCRLGPQTPEESLPVAVRLDVETFSRRSGVPAHLVVMGDPRPVDPDHASVLLKVTREALLNVAKHARAGLVLVTLRFTSDAVGVVVQDDGRGLPPGFSLQSIPVPDQGWGLPSLLRWLQQQGGSLDVRPGEQGGTVLRASVRQGPANPSSTGAHDSGSRE